MFPRSVDRPVKAKWFSGEITPDDIQDPNDPWSVAVTPGDKPPQVFQWFAFVIYEGHVLLEQSIDVTTNYTESRATEHVAGLFGRRELKFLRAIHANLDDPRPKTDYAELLESQNDARGQLLREEVERFQKEGPRRRTPSKNMCRQDICDGYIDPEDKAWYWKRLADIPVMTPEEREHERWKSVLARPYVEPPIERVPGDTIRDGELLMDYLLRIGQEYLNGESTTAIQDPFFRQTGRWNRRRLKSRIEEKLKRLSYVREELRKSLLRGGLCDSAEYYKTRENIQNVINGKLSDGLEIVQFNPLVLRRTRKR